MAVDTKILVLQVGKNNWLDTVLNLDESKQVEWRYLDSDNYVDEDFKKLKKEKINVTVFTDSVSEELFNKLKNNIEAYSLIIDKQLEQEIDKQVIDLKLPHFWDLSDKQSVIDSIARDFFSGQFGVYLRSYQIKVDESFTGGIKQNGEAYLQLKGDFSSVDNKPLLTWQKNVSLDVNNLDLVLQFEHSDDVEIELVCEKIISGSNLISEVLTFSESQIQSGITIDSNEDEAYMAVSLVVKGSGTLNVGPLHYRMSRHGYGEFLLGGKKVMDPKNNDELFYLLNPGDLKPPLTVYFSGFKGAEGFEGYYMMKALGTPFLLIADQRLQGGSFYIGSDYLEDAITQAIQDSLDKLGFTNDDLLLSGLSMGTFGALFYGTRLHPKYIVLGKPIASIGNAVANHTIVRPGMDFVESLDMQNMLEGDLTPNSSQRLNDRFWKQFKSADFTNTEFNIAYMKNDDYDATAYHDLLDVLSMSDSNVISKGVLGRHNDNTSAIVDWFNAQYKRILRKDYGRKGK
ncbi:accessory Sec system protein Asp2 [Companilactobacillus sp. RD055328]|uniref:accessory Sec system protein Asp2 n=1 Tax=Companilactobacillus sp. RD055328 TaxID=2916634 RepID=UPI001FC84646|nr:accessory Sec system protein Asp2 [Companilactobacillus sp. RD055328]GKQ42751.1 accessory Sec system protein Asp2 [Companilactobacillus sp. RD055328]